MGGGRTRREEDGWEDGDFLGNVADAPAGVAAGGVEVGTRARRRVRNWGRGHEDSRSRPATLFVLGEL